MMVILLLGLIAVAMYASTLSDKIKTLQDNYARLEGYYFNLIKRLQREEAIGEKPVLETPHPSAAPEKAPAPPPLETPRPAPAAPSTPPKPVFREGLDFVAPVKRAQPASKPAMPTFTVPAINWESFMGVKLFAWLGGFALFLGMAFFVKYSIDHNWINPLMRVSIGLIIGLGTIVGGLSMRKKGYDVTVQTLVASGIAILYADVFACRSLYNFLSNEIAFVAMILVTVAAFLLSVRLNSKYVAILGMVGGFLTPPMLSTGVDHPIALFSYILLLNTGLAAVTIRQRWGFLLGLSSLATFLTEIGWTMQFFTPAKVWLALGIYLTFGLFFILVSSVADQNDAKEEWFQAPADYLPLCSLGFAGNLLSFPDLGRHPGVIFALIFSNLALLGWRAVQRAGSRTPYTLGTVASFILLSVWTVKYMTTGMAVLSGGLYLGLCLFSLFISSRAAKPAAGSQQELSRLTDYLPVASFVLLFYFLGNRDLTAHPGLLFTLLFLFVALLAWRAVIGDGSTTAYVIGSALGFAVLGGWTIGHLTPENIWLAVAVFLGYSVFHVLISRSSEADHPAVEHLHSPADYLPLGSMGFVWYMLQFPALGHRPGIVLGFLMILSGLLAYRALKRPAAQVPYGIGGAFSFFLLAYWTVNFMRSSLLPWGLGFYMAFAIVHTLYPILYKRLRKSTTPLLTGFIAPMLGLSLILLAMTACDLLSFLLWPFVLMLGFLGVAFAWIAGSLLAALATIFLVMASLGVWIFRLPDPGGLSTALLLMAGFTTMFFAWTLLVTRGKSLFSGNAMLSRAGAIDRDEANSLPAFTALMPFILLMIAALHLKLPNPSEIFAMSLFLDVLLLALARYRKMEFLVVAAMFGTFGVEFFWLGANPDGVSVLVQAGWALVFYTLFTVYPFLFRKKLSTLIPWRCAAIAGLVQWPVLWDACKVMLGPEKMALVPALLALPSLLCLLASIRHEKNDQRVSKLAWFGGITLFYITLIIPIHFDKEWLTVGWTLEGAALIWLFRRVPHEGLKVWGLGLLAICFARLALNPAVLSYHPRGEMPIFNWYLWVYGIGAAAFYAAAHWIKDEPEYKGYLKALGTVLAFLLLNIEIADYFSTGAAITFNFSGNLGQDMTYSLAWAVFSILMLVAGINQKSKPARYASIGLLTLTLGKLFMHDLWRLGGLYRVASFVGLAIVLILVSFLYQKFIASEEKTGGAS